MTEPPPAACHRCRRSAVRDLGRTAQLPQLAIQPALSQQNGSNGGAGTAVPGAVPETSALQPPPHLLGPGHPRPFESFQQLRCRLRPSELHSPAGLGSSRHPTHGRNSWPRTRPGPAPLPPFPPGPPRYRPPPRESATGDPPLFPTAPGPRFAAGRRARPGVGFIARRTAPCGPTALRSPWGRAHPPRGDKALPPGRTCRHPPPPAPRRQRRPRPGHGRTDDAPPHRDPRRLRRPSPAAPLRAAPRRAAPPAPSRAAPAPPPPNRSPPPAEAAPLSRPAGSERRPGPPRRRRRALGRPRAAIGCRREGAGPGAGGDERGAGRRGRGSSRARGARRSRRRPRHLCAGSRGTEPRGTARSAARRSRPAAAAGGRGAARPRAVFGKSCAGSRDRNKSAVTCSPRAARSRWGWRRGNETWHASTAGPTRRPAGTAGRHKALRR